MRNIFAVLFSILLMFQVQAADMLDVDYNFIDTAFDGIKPVTNKQFDDTINKLTPQPVADTFKDKVKTFFFGRKYGVEPPKAQGQDIQIDIGGEKKAIEDMKNGVYYIKLLVSIVGFDGRTIPLGNYKIKEETEDGVSMLIFYQGNSEYGRLKLKEFNDTLKEENELTYSRVDIISDDVVRVVYSTIKYTKCAYARVK